MRPRFLIAAALFLNGCVVVADEQANVSSYCAAQPQGINSYPLLELAGHGDLFAVRSVFQRARALQRAVIRTNAFFDGGTSPARIRNDDGSINESGLVALDHVLALAAEEHVQLLLVLANHWNDYGGAAAVVRMAVPEETLPRAAFYTDERVIAFQEAYLRTILARTNSVNGHPYASDDVVYAWELANEPRCDDASVCHDGAIAEWTQTMADTVRSAHVTQPIAWGGEGQLGAQEHDFDEVAASHAVDILTLHLYTLASSTDVRDPISSVTRASLAAYRGANLMRYRAQIAADSNTRLLVEELGWKPLNDNSEGDHERAFVMSSWLSEAAKLGIGTLPWMIAENGRPNYDGFLLTAESTPESYAAITCASPLVP